MSTSHSSNFKESSASVCKIDLKNYKKRVKSLSLDKHLITTLSTFIFRYILQTTHYAMAHRLHSLSFGRLSNEQ